MWYQALNEYFVQKAGFIQCAPDSCLYDKCNRSVYISVRVNDMLVAASNLGVLNREKAEFSRGFAIYNLGVLNREKAEFSRRLAIYNL